MMIRFVLRVFFLLMLLLWVNQFVYAQEEPILADLRGKLKSEALSVGVLAQFGGTLQFDPEEATNGFRIRNARISLRGNLDSGFNYFMQTELVSSIALLDARLGYDFNDRVGIHAGLYKAPFGGGYLITLSKVDLVERSLLTTLVPRRQVGVTLHGNNPSNVVRYTIGMFNGNGRTLGGNDNNAMMFVGRVVASPRIEGQLDIGINFSFSEDGAGEARTIWQRMGADFRYTRDQLLLSGEVVYTDSNPEAAGIAGTNPLGYHATIGYMIKPGVQQILLRFDALDRDIPGVDAQNQLVFGYNYWPTGAFLLQVNYLLPVDASTTLGHAIIAKLQFSI